MKNRVGLGTKLIPHHSLGSVRQSSLVYVTVWLQVWARSRPDLTWIWDGFTWVMGSL